MLHDNHDILGCLIANNCDGLLQYLGSHLRAVYRSKHFESNLDRIYKFKVMGGGLEKLKIEQRSALAGFSIKWFIYS